MNARFMLRLRSYVIVLLACAYVSCAPSDDVRADDAARVSAEGETRARVVATDALPRVVFLGDSLTAGYGLAQGEAVPALIQDRLLDEGYAYHVVAAGVSGDTSAGGLSRLNYSLEGNVAALVIELGANDGLRGLPPESLRRNLLEIIDTARTRGIKVLLTGMEAPPNFGQAYTAEFRQVYRDLARDEGVAFVPFYLEGVAGVPELNIADGMHPNAEGSRVIQQTIWTALEPLLERTSAAGAHVP
jgi:acyl-CoA thioesterase-1